MSDNPLTGRAAERWGQWFDEVYRLGIAEGIFDKQNAKFACPGSKARRPYKGEDGFFRACFTDGMTPQQALSESMVEQDGY